jgi:hypothetical protein
MTTLIPEAADRLTPPWRFRLGDNIYVRGRGFDETFKVVGGELWLGFPHLTLVDPAGRTWRVAQIECSSRPITYRKG